MKRTALLFLSYLIVFTTNAQKAKVDLNTIFVCVDATTYASLFKNSFIKDTLFICREQQTQTNTDNYNGKYAIGKAATLEFFKPINTSKLGDKFGDVGIEFKTRKLKDLLNYIKIAKRKGLAYKVDTTKLPQDEQSLNWYSEFTVNNPTSNRFTISILEYEKAYLLSLGFKEEEINTSMTYEAYNSILANGRKYPRKFNYINYINLSLNKEEFVELKNMAGLLGLMQKGLSFIGDSLRIDYKIDPHSNFKLNKIGIKLTEATVNKTVKVSQNLDVITKDNEALLVFSYK